MCPEPSAIRKLATYLAPLGLKREKTASLSTSLAEMGSETGENPYSFVKMARIFACAKTAGVLNLSNSFAWGSCGPEGSTTTSSVRGSPSRRGALRWESSGDHKNSWENCGNSPGVSVSENLRARSWRSSRTPIHPKTAERVPAAPEATSPHLSSMVGSFWGTPDAGTSATAAGTSDETAEGFATGGGAETADSDTFATDAVPTSETP